MEDNRKRCIGLTDLPLSDFGRRQAEKTGKWLAQQGIKRIYSSPLCRCRETAAVVRSVLADRGVVGNNYSCMSPLQNYDTSMRNHDISIGAILIRENLREMSMGIWENLTFDEIKEKYPEEYAKRGENLGYYEIPEGESFAQAGKRFKECMEGILSESEEDILVVAHAGVIRAYLCRLLNLSANEVMKLPQPYGGITVLEEVSKKEQNIVFDTAMGIEEEKDYERDTSHEDGATLSVELVGWKPYIFLNQEDIDAFYGACDTPNHVINHMKAVASYIDELKRQLPREVRKRYDWNLLRKAALLHDIKRLEPNHAKAGADYLMKEGYPEIARLVEKHHECPEEIQVENGLDSFGGTLEEQNKINSAYSELRGQENLLEEPLTEEEILFYADKRVCEDQIVTIEERFFRSKEKCRSREALEKHERLYRKTLLIQEKLMRL